MKRAPAKKKSAPKTHCELCGGAFTPSQPIGVLREDGSRLHMPCAIRLGAVKVVER